MLVSYAVLLVSSTLSVCDLCMQYTRSKCVGYRVLLLRFLFPFCNITTCSQAAAFKAAMMDDGYISLYYYELIETFSEKVKTNNV